MDCSCCGLRESLLEARLPRGVQSTKGGGVLLYLSGSGSHAVWQRLLDGCGYSHKRIICGSVRYRCRNQLAALQEHDTAARRLLPPADPPAAANPCAPATAAFPATGSGTLSALATLLPSTTRILRSAESPQAAQGGVAIG